MIGPFQEQDTGGRQGGEPLGRRELLVKQGKGRRDLAEAGEDPGFCRGTTPWVSLQDGGRNSPRAEHEPLSEVLTRATGRGRGKKRAVWAWGRVTTQWWQEEGIPSLTPVMKRNHQWIKILTLKKNP